MNTLKIDRAYKNGELMYEAKHSLYECPKCKRLSMGSWLTHQNCECGWSSVEEMEREIGRI